MDDSAKRTIFCGNLSSEVADEILYELFIQAGPLEKVSIPKQGDGRSKGYGFVTFKHECSVPYAMDLMKGVQLFGRPLNLQNRTGPKADNSSNDNRNQHHQRSMSLQEDFRPHQGASNMDPLSVNAFLDAARLASQLIGGQMMQGYMQQMQQGYMPPPYAYQNHQRSRSHHGSDCYYDGNSREDRRDFYNRSDRHRSRDNSSRGQPRDNDYHDRHRGGGGHRDRGWDRDRDRDRNRPNHRPHENRYRSRD